MAVRDRLKRIEYVQNLHKQEPNKTEEQIINQVMAETGITSGKAYDYISLLKVCGKW